MTSKSDVLARIQEPLSGATHSDKSRSFGSSIERLADEILQEIFFQHVWINLDTPVRLVLVCRSWYIAATYPALWGNIYYGVRNYRNLLYKEYARGSNRTLSGDVISTGISMDVNDRDGGGIDLCERIQGMVHCSTQESLLRALDRTGNSKFELTIYEVHPLVYPTGFKLELGMLHEPKYIEAFSTRCRLIRIVDVESYSTFIPWMQTIQTSDDDTNESGARGFMSLEEFICPDHSTRPSSSNTMLRSLQDDCPRLYSLAVPHLRSWASPLGLLRQLKRLSVGSVDNFLTHDNDGEIGGEGVGDTNDSPIFQNLEELRLVGVCDFNHPTPSLQKLSVVDIPIWLLSRIPIPLDQLTHLSTDFYTFRESSHRDRNEVITFPALTYLAVQGDWRIVQYMNVPALLVLIMRNMREQSGGGQENLVRGVSENMNTNAVLSPSILHIDDNLPPNEFSDFLRLIGKALKKLFITCIDQDRVITKTLVDDMIGSPGRALICPYLQRLDLISPEPRAWTDRNTTRNRLQRIIKARTEMREKIVAVDETGKNGDGGLSWVRYGLYQVHPSDLKDCDRTGTEVLQDASRNWWNTTWYQLL